MNSKKILLLPLIIIALSIFTGCEEVSDPADECEKTKWENAKEHTIYLSGTMYLKQKINNIEFQIDTAHHIQAIGSIQKYYCNSTPSGKFDFNLNYFPDTDNIIIPMGAYIFRFENDEDHLRVNLKWKLYFNDGQAYESLILVNNFYYKDLYYFDNKYELFYDCFEVNWTKVN